MFCLIYTAQKYIYISNIKFIILQNSHFFAVLRCPHRRHPDTAQQKSVHRSAGLYTSTSVQIALTVYGLSGFEVPFFEKMRTSISKQHFTTYQKTIGQSSIATTT